MNLIRSCVSFSQRRRFADGGLVMPEYPHGLVMIPATSDLRSAREVPEAVACLLQARGIATLSILRRPGTESLLKAMFWARSTLDTRLPIGILGWGQAAAFSAKAAALSPATVRALGITALQPEDDDYLRLVSCPVYLLSDLSDPSDVVAEAQRIGRWFEAALLPRPASRPASAPVL